MENFVWVAAPLVIFLAVMAAELVCMRIRNRVFVDSLAQELKLREEVITIKEARIMELEETIREMMSQGEYALSEDSDD